MASLYICLLGNPRIEKDGQIFQVPRRKSLALLAYLAVEGRMQSRETLAALFWPDHDPSSAYASLRRELSRLKGLFGRTSVIVADRLQAGLDPALEIRLDIADFLRRVEQPKLHGHSQESLCTDCFAMLKEAVELYRDDFLEGFNLPDSPAFDEWRFFRAEELRQRLAETLQRLIGWYASREEYEQGILYARRWLALDRLHEPAQRLLMQLYAWSGQQAAAVRQYEECRRVLQEELGLEPEEETRALYEAIRSRSLDLPGPGGEASPAEDWISQSIRFCHTPDGVRLAYATAGQGPVLVKAANWLSHLEYDWTSPVWRHWLRGLTEGHTLVRYDERGCGLSDWNVDEFSLDAWVMDLETVVDSLGLERFPLLGISQGASIAVEYAVRHPQKVSCLVLYGGYLRGRMHRDLAPAKKAEMEMMIQLIRIGWGQEHAAFRQVFSSLFLPDGTPEQMEAFNELQRVTSSPEIAARIVSGFQGINVLERAGRITQPALVLHARGDLRIPFEEGRLTAATIPNARLVTLESRNHILLEDEPAWGRFLEEVQAFLKENGG